MSTPATSAPPATRRRLPRAARATAVVLAATVLQLAVAAFVPNLAQFEGKAFGARLVAYPLMMLVVPALWWLAARRHRPGPRDVPWAAFGWVMLPFLLDVTGNTLDLYDRVWWWDDANHLVNWFFLSLGLGLLMARAAVRPAWALWLAVAGAGAALAIGWELGEWYTFIRHGTELATAYTDTLGDEALGTLGAAVAGLVVVGLGRDRAARPAASGDPHPG
jgi:hypothetical protein